MNILLVDDDQDLRGMVMTLLARDRFEARELVARIKTVLRRSNPREEVGGDQESVTLHFAGYVLDLTHRQLMREGGEDIELTSGEFDLLRALAEAPNRPLTRDRLLDLTRSREWSPFDRSVDVLIGRIRKKLEPDPTRPTLIKTVRTVGYILASKVERRGARANSNPTASGMTA